MKYQPPTKPPRKPPQRIIIQYLIQVIQKEIQVIHIGNLQNLMSSKRTAKAKDTET